MKSVLKMGNRILMIGIGNHGRSDDALGWKFVEKFSKHEDLFDIEYRYQLQIEDALLITEYKVVIFVDAAHTTYDGGYSLYKCIPARTDQFTSHALNPETILWLANDLFSQSPEAYVMAISGINWELHQGITDTAQKNFEQAVSFFKNWLTKKDLPHQN